MFKNYKDITDVVSVIAYCPAERAYLLTKESSGEFWIPSAKSEKNCWKLTAHKINFELFGADAAQCIPLRVYKVWLPNHPHPYVYHAVYKTSIKSEIKKKTKMKANVRSRFQWFTMLELDRQRAHCNLRSPELVIFATMAIGDTPKDVENQEIETGMLIEICEENVILGSDVAAGAASLPHVQLLQAAHYSRDDQIRLYREFLMMVFPALYMSNNVFTLLMVDVGWQRGQCPSLFRAADVTSRGGLSFLELMLWNAALEPATQHSGLPAEIRCRYIFRYFDTNRDLKLEYLEFKELVGAARAARHLSIDALSVAREADVCLRQLGMQPNSTLPLAEFLRGVGELRLRGTSSLLRSPRSISEYLIDLQERDTVGSQKMAAGAREINEQINQTQTTNLEASPSESRRPVAILQNSDYNLASYTVRLNREGPNELLELKHFDEEAVSASTARVIPGMRASLELLSPASLQTEAIAAVHYFAAPTNKLPHNIPRRDSAASLQCEKAAWSWGGAGEAGALGALLLRLADAARDLCAREPRLLRLQSPVFVVGDLHGNLSALMAMEAALWPYGLAMAPARMLFLGDYVDRGPHGTELMAYLLAAKVQRPNAVFLIRGNHETRDIQKMFTFHSECIDKYGEGEGNKIWTAINNVFDVLPLAAVVDDKIFCCHGGIPPPWVCPLISAIDKVPSPLPRPAEQSSIAWELLWNDPVKSNKVTATMSMELAANEGFAANTRRGTGHVFNQLALDRFLTANRLSHVLRAHEMHQAGFMCQLKGRLISVFSSSHYCGGSNDCGAALLDSGKLRLLRITTD